MPRLPSEYQEVEYIQSSGTQYIDTGFKGNQDTAFEVKARMTSANSANQNWVGGDLDDANSISVVFGTGTNSPNNRFGGAVFALSYSDTAVGTDYVVYTDKNKYTLNGTAKTRTGTVGTFQTTYNMRLFQVSIKNGTEGFIGRIYYAKIWNNGTLVRKLIPCYRKQDGVIGMYDMVNGVFYTNQGTGTFTKGADKDKVVKIGKVFVWKQTARLPSAYKEVEYIETHCTGGSSREFGSFIDTGVYMNPNYVVELQYAMNQFSSYDTLFGCRNSGNAARFTARYGSNGGEISFQRACNGYEYKNISSLGNDTNKHIVKMSKEVYFDGVLKHTFSNSAYTGNFPLTLYLGAVNCPDETPNVVDIANMKIFYFKITDTSNNLVRDLVPCYRRSDGVIGMYDTVNSVFYTNAGTGNFTKGSDIQTYKEFQIRPNQKQNYEFFYDFRGGSVAGFQAAGGGGIYTDGSYTIDSNGLGQTSSSSDKMTMAWLNGIDCTGAKKITVSCLASWVANSWSNGKFMELRGSTAGNSGNTNPAFRGTINLNTSSPTQYSENGIYYVNSGGTGSWIQKVMRAAGGGQTTMKHEFDLVNKTWKFTTTGGDNYTYSTTLTDSQISDLQLCHGVRWYWYRGYSSYNNERLKTVSITIEF